MDAARVAVVVEDDEDIGALLAAVLEQAGFDVHTAATGVDALDLVRTHDPIVTTLDVGLPGMDGFALLRVQFGEVRGQFDQYSGSTNAGERAVKFNSNNFSEGVVAYLANRALFHWKAEFAGHR